MIANCGHDENNQYHGGKPGDQTGTEWCIKPYANYGNGGYLCILRHPNEKVREMIADQAEKGAKNDNIGYCQWTRAGFEKALVAANNLVENISTKCNTDCSGGVTSIVRATGRRIGDSKLSSISTDTYTKTMRDNFRAAGFSVYTAKKYFPNDDYHLRGDIILADDHHVIVSLSNGSKSGVTSQNETPKKSNEVIANEVIAGAWGVYPERKTKLEAAGYSYDAIQKIVNEKLAAQKAKTPSYTKYKVVHVTSYLNVRKGPGTSHASVGTLRNGSTINVVSISGNWAKLDNGYYVSTSYIAKV